MYGIQLTPRAAKPFSIMDFDFWHGKEISSPAIGIAFAVGLKESALVETMAVKYKAEVRTTYNGYIKFKFKTKDQVEEAVNWLESLYVINKLSGN